MNGRIKILSAFIFILLALFLVNVIFADNSVTLVSPATQVVTTGVNYVYINLTSNESIATNGSTIFSWWNETGANVNFTGNQSGTIVANATGPNAPADFSNYTSRNFTTLNDGVHRFMIYLYSNNTVTTNSTSINVTVSTLTAHNLALNNPAVNNLTNLSVNYVFINVSSNETVSANASSFISWWNETGANINFTDVTVVNRTGSANVTRNITNLADGQHRFMVYAYSNNTLKTNSTSINITVDTTAPSVTVVPFNGSSPLTTEDNTPQINVTATDAQLNVTGWNISIQIFVDRVMRTKSSLINNTRPLYNLSQLTLGNHTVQVEGNDSVGNRVNSTAITLNIDNQTNSPNMTLHSATANSLVFVGNISKTYTLSVLFNMTNATGILTNVTFFMPYGFMPAVGGVPNVVACNAGGSLRSTGKYNITHVSCSVFLGNASGNNILANLTVIANYSAMPQYGLAYTFESKLTCGNNLGCATINTSWALQGTPYQFNPRPDAVIVTGTNVTVQFSNWNQTDSGLRVQTPIFTFDPTLGRPVLANNSYGELIYFDKSMFEMPTFMRLWSYNLTFKVIFDGPANATNITIRNPVNTTQADLVTQTLVPLLVMTREIPDFHTNTSVNMTTAMPGPNGFTIYWNGSNYSSSALQASTGIIMQFTGGQGNPPDQSSSLLTLTIPNDTIAERINNTDISVLFTTANISACGTTSCSTSPLFVNTQEITGWSAQDPPDFGQVLNISYVINATNRFVNYTLSNLSITIMQPMNVTINESGTIHQFNMTRNIHISAWNGTNFHENLSVIRRESNMTFTEQMGPGAGARISLYITTFDIQLDSSSANSAFNSTFAWAPNSNATIIVNFTAEMEFPVMSETAIPSGAANGSYSYNATIQVPQRAAMNLTAKVPGINTANCGSTGSSCTLSVSVDGSAVAASNLTIGSLMLDDLASGQHTVTVTYTIPAAAGTTTSTTASGGGTLTQHDETSTTFLAISSGTTNTMTISKDAIKVKKLEFVSSVSASNVKVTVGAVPKPSSVPDLEKVYQWINITHTNLVDSAITSAKIYFNVSKTWLDSNNLTQSEIYLQRYDGSWNILDTTRLGESATEVQYRALSSGLSIFAITGIPTQEPVTPEPPEQEAVCGNSVIEGSEQCDVSDFGSSTCASYGFDSGTLACTASCTIDTTNCVAAVGGTEDNGQLNYDYTTIATIVIILVIVLGLGSFYYKSVRNKQIPKK